MFLVILLGTFNRINWLRHNQLEEGTKTLPIESGTTQIAFLTYYQNQIVFAVQIPVLIIMSLRYSAGKLFFWRVMVPYLTAYMIFAALFFTERWWFTFDTSDHVANSLLCLSVNINTIYFVAQTGDDIVQRTDDDFQRNIGSNSKRCLIVLLGIIYAVLLIHGCWSCYYACYIYHKVSESLAGFMFGIFLILVCQKMGTIFYQEQ